MIEPVPAVERRHNHRLREIFDDAYARVEPLLDPTQSWGGSPLLGLAYPELREAYPELSPAEARTLVVALVRVHRAARGKVAPRLPMAEGLVQGV